MEAIVKGGDMSTKAGTIGVSARPVWFPLWTAVVSGLAVAALIMSAVALGLAVRGDERAAVPAPREVIASGSVITGTGPDLIAVAQESVRTAALRRVYEGSSVTGTGPGLIEVAQESVRTAALRRATKASALLRIYSGSLITGTGPGLVDAAFDHSVPKVTGTGPGLVQVAEWTRGE
jgi:hypothetical protein